MKKKIIVSILVIGLLFSIAPPDIGGEEAVNNGEEVINGYQCDASESIQIGEPIQLPLYDEFEYVPGELIVKLSGSLNIGLSPDGFVTTGFEPIDDLNEKHGVTSAKKIFKTDLPSSLSNIYKFILPDDANIPSVAEEYNDNIFVVYAEPNYIFNIDVIPNDERFSDQWALHNTGQTGGTSDADIDAPEAWNIETGDDDIVIAVIDSGVDYNHPDLEDNIWINDDEIPDNGVDDDNNGYIDDYLGFDFVNSEDANGDGDYDDPDDTNDPDPMDDNGHGTHCAGIISAVGNNDDGIAGVCWNCKIMPVKGLNQYGSGDDSNLAKAIHYAIINDADIISMSWGSHIQVHLVHDVLKNAYSQGVLLITSAGNDDTDWKHYPAAFNEVIAVASTDHKDEKADSSNHGYWVDVAAPGVDILSTIPDNKYRYMSGTSMACPHVSGLAGLLLSKNSCSYPAGMAKTMIINTVDQISSTEDIGSGRINAYQALLQKPAIAILHTKSNWKDDAQGTVNIEGHAWGETFQQYVLEYGRGRDPDTWTEMKSSSNSQSGILFSWNTNQVYDGLYAVRLTVTCIDGVYTDKTWIVVNNEQNTIHVDASNTGGPWDGTSDNPFRYICDGVDDAGKDDEVVVHNGIYYEQHIFVEKTLELVGEDLDATIIDGGGCDFIVLVSAESSCISDFTIKNGQKGIFLWEATYNKINGNYITNNDNGIHLERSSHNTISENTIIDNDYGIRMKEESTDNTLSENTISDNEYGIKIFESYGNIVSDNSISDNNYGIYVDRSSYTYVFSNIIESNVNGLEITQKFYEPNPYETTNNNIYHNNITDNVRGVYIHRDSICSPSDNNLYANNFINNNQNAYDECPTNWDNGSIGNYWDDYNGNDLNGDGIGDTPYKIPDGDSNPLNNNKDTRPLMKPWPKSYNNNQNNQQSNQQQNSNQQSQSQSQSSSSSQQSSGSSSSQTQGQSIPLGGQSNN